jgi:hypothetical protein
MEKNLLAIIMLVGRNNWSKTAPVTSHCKVTNQIGKKTIIYKLILYFSQYFAFPYYYFSIGAFSVEFRGVSVYL